MGSMMLSRFLPRAGTWFPFNFILFNCLFDLFYVCSFFICYFFEVPTWYGGGTFTEGEDTGNYSRYRWWMVHTSSRSWMLPSCSGTTRVAWKAEREESQ